MSAKYAQIRNIDIGKIDKEALSLIGILNDINFGPKIIGGFVSPGVAMVILAYILLSSISCLNTKFNFLVHHDTAVLINA